MIIKPDKYHINTSSLQHTLSSSLDFKSNFQCLFNQLNATFVMHIRRYTDGSVFYLSSNPELVDFFFRNRCYNYSQGERHPSAFHKGFSLWDSWQPKENDINEYLRVTKPLKENFNAAHGIMIFEPKESFCDLYSIASSRDNRRASLNFMANYKRVIGAINHYQDNAKVLIDRAHALRHKNIYDASVNLFEDKGNNQIISDQEPFNGSSISIEEISKREVECLYWLSNGLTAKEIAKKVPLSHRSIEIYIARLKEKLKCKNTCQLGYLVGAYKQHFNALFKGI
jgi:DNA-binding CsgD family transcriptional regulator